MENQKLTSHDITYYTSGEKGVRNDFDSLRENQASSTKEISDNKNKWKL